MHTSGDIPVDANTFQLEGAAREQESQPAGNLRQDSVSAPNNSLSSSLRDAMLKTDGKASADEADRNKTAETLQQSCKSSAHASEVEDKASIPHSTAATNGSTAELPSAMGGDPGLGNSKSLPEETAAADRQPQTEDASPAPDAARSKGRPRHYWGQALQYLEKSADVTKGELPVHSTL